MYASTHVNMSKVNYILRSYVASLRIFQLDHRKWDSLLQHKKPSVSTIQNYISLHVAILAYAYINEENCRED